MPQKLGISQAASYLGVSKDTLRRWERQGKLKALRSPSNRRLYTKKILDQSLSKPALNPVPPKSRAKESKPLLTSFQKQMIVINIFAVVVISLLLYSLIQYLSQ